MSSHQHNPAVHEQCKHAKGFTLSSGANVALIRPSTPERIKAAHENEISSRDLSNSASPARATFPGPLITPGDALDTTSYEVEPDEAQSFTDWLHEEDKNPVTQERRTIYVAAPPRINEKVHFMLDWKVPQTQSVSHTTVTHPNIRDVIQYIAAFYWPLPVKELGEQEFTQWVDSPPRKKRRKDTASSRGENSESPHVGLHDVSTGALTRIRSRAMSRKRLYGHQLSLNDLIDAMIESVPDDAYAIVLLVEHDLYEDISDEFVIGRAYGGSRVAVVSIARYDPALDVLQNVSTQHGWPLSHCAEYLENLGCKLEKSQIVKLKGQGKRYTEPMLAAISYALAVGKIDARSADERTKLWLHRICRTVSHELGHCFAFDHCLYYGCIMQSSANAAEDARQPAYLCPVDLAKLSSVTNSKGKEIMRYQRLANVCKSLGPGGGFDALDAWITARVEELKLLRD